MEVSVVIIFFFFQKTVVNLAENMCKVLQNYHHHENVVISNENVIDIVLSQFH